MRSTIIFSALLLLVVGLGSANAQSEKPDSSQPNSQSAQTPPQSKPQPKSGELAEPKAQLPQDKPLGAAGASRDKRKPSTEDAEFMVIRDRWRIGVPDDPRFKKGDLKNPYRQNVLKGDYPIIGNDIFMNISLASESDFTVRRIPVPQDVSSQRPGSFEFFGRGRQEIFNQNFVFSMDLFKGDASFKPVDWRFKITGIANFNLLNVRENGITNIDVRRGTLRRDGFNSIEEVFFEYRLGDTTKVLPFLRGKGSQGGRSPEFDTTSIRVGIQPFTSDFRGFIFSDSNLGARLFGNFKNNRWQYNLAYFHMLEKDTNSGLNTINFAETDFRNQQVYIANVFRQDTFVKGYTTQFSLHYNDDRPTTEYDQNGFLVRPARIGRVTQHRIRSGYFGWAGDGHFGRMNITHAAYQVIGRDTFNQLANRATRINAQMAAAELSIDYDYIRYRVGAFYSSGDANPLDDTGRGFDSILDNTTFAGGKFSFWNSQAMRLTQTGVALVEPRSLIPSLRSSKIQGQSNFVNPGLTLYNAGIDVDVTPKLRGFLNYNYLRFNRTEPLELGLFQPAIRHEIGHDLGVGFIYRPLLNENIVIVGGASGLRPGVGFTDIFSSNCNGTPLGCGAGPPTLWAAFVTVKFVY
ncbi:MAG: hypothetical protein SF097_01440 [Acidobacteriota bacterium]|nr:hypothetical protein [Acidobacteriota bacterium]